MALTLSQQQILEQAIATYAFPAVYYDFEAGQPINAIDITNVEDYIHTLLTSNNLEDIKHGLANVLYWGYAQIGYRDTRVAIFLNNITTTMLNTFRTMVANGTPSLRDIRGISMPQFSATSFISKIIAFLDPESHCVLDNQIIRIISEDSARMGKALNDINTYPTSIPVTIHNNANYERWCAECLAISQAYYQGKYRAIDVERGFFCQLQFKIDHFLW